GKTGSMKPTLWQTKNRGNLILLYLFGGKRSAESSTSHDKGMRVCPFCAESIKMAAIKCKHCGSEVEMQAKPSLSPLIDKPEQMSFDVKQETKPSLRRFFKKPKDMSLGIEQEFEPSSRPFFQKPEDMSLGVAGGTNP
ncbi:MAG: hypothetical protein WCA83_03620, partial [Azonexus sp.]